MRGYRGRHDLRILWRALVRELRELLDSLAPQVDADDAARQVARRLIREGVEGGCDRVVESELLRYGADYLEPAELASVVAEICGAWERFLVHDRVLARVYESRGEDRPGREAGDAR